MSKQEGNIIWLASYPKSGNTWLRVFLNNLLSESSEPIDINALHKTGLISSARSIFDEWIGIDSADLRREEIDFYLPKAHLLRSRQLTDKQFVKTHDAFTKNKQGEWIIPLEATYKVIYLLRNPLDVCVSFAYHSGHQNFDKMIERMASSRMALATSKRGQNNQLHQYMGTWSEHVNSWIQNIPSDKLLIVRYEDMKLNTLATFTKIVEFTDLTCTKEQVKNAIKKSNIEHLQKMENEYGFIEKSHYARRFFRKGEINTWNQELTSKQVVSIRKDHEELMSKFDYHTWELSKITI